ncbi:hypothetical protein [Halobaculum sp. D14]
MTDAGGDADREVRPGTMAAVDHAAPSPELNDVWARGASRRADEEFDG